MGLQASRTVSSVVFSFRTAHSCSRPPSSKPTPVEVRSRKRSERLAAMPTAKLLSSSSPQYVSLRSSDSKDFDTLRPSDNIRNIPVSFSCMRLPVRFRCCNVELHAIIVPRCSNARVSLENMFQDRSKLRMDVLCGTASARNSAALIPAPFSERLRSASVLHSRIASHTAPTPVSPSLLRAKFTSRILELRPIALATKVIP
mmetsp:Transcript_19005/g.43661  ORF Transcript_19005/g.43661 Transcript_19005/m.43661 type:complete len:201 (+) Transcript_19005:324-926(+)